MPSLKSKRRLSFLCAGGRVSHSLTSPPKSKEACLWDNNVLVRHTKHAVFYTAVDFVRTGVCQIKIRVSRHQLVSRTRSHTVAVCQISAAVTQQLRRKPNSDIPECIYALTWRSCILSVAERTRGPIGHCRRHIWTVSSAIPSPVEGLSHSVPHLPLMDSRCPTGFWTLSARDVPNVHQLPGRQFRARHQRQAHGHKKNHSERSVD